MGDFPSSEALDCPLIQYPCCRNYQFLCINLVEIMNMCSTVRSLIYKRLNTIAICIEKVLTTSSEVEVAL